MKTALTLLLSWTGGAVDAIGFLLLYRLFTAQMSAAAATYLNSPIIAPLVALLPLICVAVLGIMRDPLARLDHLPAMALQNQKGTLNF